MTVLQGLQTRLRLARLYAFADARRVDDIGSYVAALTAGGAGLIQVKLHGLGRTHRAAAFEQVREACRAAQVIAVVEGDLPVAAHAEADALLLDGDRVAAARNALGRWALLGRRVTSGAELTAAAAAGFSYALVGSAVHGGAVTDLVGSAVAAQPPADESSLVWFADGGITPGSVGEVLAAGARRIAVGTALMEAADPRAVCAELAAAVDAAWTADPAMSTYTLRAFGNQPVGTLREATPATGPAAELHADPGQGE